MTLNLKVRSKMILQKIIDVYCVLTDTLSWEKTSEAHVLILNSVSIMILRNTLTVSESSNHQCNLPDLQNILW